MSEKELEKILLTLIDEGFIDYGEVGEGRKVVYLTTVNGTSAEKRLKQLLEKKRMTPAGKIEILSELLENNKMLENNIDKVLTYCQPHTEMMWSASIISMLLNCDFRDSKEKVDGYLDNKRQSNTKTTADF